MMTQADILGKNQDPFLDPKSARPSGFTDSQFPDSIPNLSEQSPIRPSKYFASDSAINTSKGMRRIITGGLVFTMVVTLALIIQIIFGDTQVPNRIGIVTQEAACSDIGAQMVRMGGNSIDAFIASSLCLSVVNPFAAGLGAGGFLIVRDHKHNRNLAVNCFFKSSNNVEPPISNPIEDIESIAVPGELKCLQTVYHKYARFSWKTLTWPSIELARNGFKVSKTLGENVQKLEKSDFDQNPIMAEMFFPNQTYVKEGDVIKNPKLAHTLELLNQHDYVFYHKDGTIGNELIEELNENGKAPITQDDLNMYTVELNDLVTVNFDDFVLLTTSYPSAGPVIKFIIELIKSFPASISDLKTAAFYDRLLEATKLGYILGSYISDPNYRPDQESFYDQKFTTLGSVWGSKFMSENGYFLNNALSLFSYDHDEKTNQPGKNRQPRGLIAPILTYNKKNPCIRRFSVSYSHKGNMNDDLAFSELAQVITKILTDFSLYETALTDKRLQFQPLKNESRVCFEDGFDSKIRSQIESEGIFKPSNSCMFHSIDLVMKKDHIIYGQADVTRSQDSLVVFN